ncbi:hypothetical protein C0J52_20539 [Blattella germanica]|nr:hypothetical protein C0J52_20539 [Blattella germanica]
MGRAGGLKLLPIYADGTSLKSFGSCIFFYLVFPVLERNSGYDSLYTVGQILSGEIRDTPKDISPNSHPPAK